jgi:hypothetical protein
MSIATDEATVRTYLRALVGAPERRTDELAVAEDGFVRVGARWCARAGVDRRTLANVGVPKSVLDLAAIIQAPIEDVVRAHYSRQPFDLPTLTRRACVGEASVRKTVAQDERIGRIERVNRPGRSVVWRLTKR